MSVREDGVGDVAGREDEVALREEEEVLIEKVDRNEEVAAKE